MNALAATLGHSMSTHPLRIEFLKWQCRVRQIAARDADGRPDGAISPTVTLDGQEGPMGHIITVLNKSPGYSLTPEMEHLAAKTNDPAQRRDHAIQFLSATYYQKAGEFSDILTATFPPASPGAGQLRAAERVTLVFEAYAQKYSLACRVWKLAPRNPLYRATLAHNRLFNPDLSDKTVVLGFEPDWGLSTSGEG